MTTFSSLYVDFADEAQTARMAGQLATAIQAAADAGELPITIFLRGHLGVGKTTFVRGVLRGLGFNGRVKSPTYALVEVYTVSRLNLYHFDFYRLKDPDEWHEAGFRDSLTDKAISLIEWPEKAQGAQVPLPLPDLDIHLTAAANLETQRRAHLTATTQRGQQLLAKLRA
ncbi:MAG: tRNA (adenosine(37)-N6)-threonylcarbamoyltransferase complex ATPase subunit type 1 TsaE [Betaproteobacteria bacterium]|jgi:tRNA threonylcarbamoyladenosine biosynthesis protein TsaE